MDLKEKGGEGCNPESFMSGNRGVGIGHFPSPLLREKDDLPLKPATGGRK